MLNSKFPLWIGALMVVGALTLHGADTAAQAAARAALDQKMKELDANPSAATAVPAPASAAVTPVVPAAAAVAPAAAAVAIEVTPAGATAVPVTPATAPAAAAAPAVGDNPAQAAARVALQQKMNEPVASQPAPAPTPVPAPAQVTPMKTVPTLPVVMSKADKLNWLLSLYKTDQLSPQQYHEQRAAILAEP